MAKAIRLNATLHPIVCEDIIVNDINNQNCKRDEEKNIVRGSKAVKASTVVDHSLFSWAALIDSRPSSLSPNIVRALGRGRLDKGDKCNEGYFPEFQLI